MTDALNHTTSYVYDSLNRKTRINYADNSFTETTFDVLGRRISEKDQAGKVTQFVYDSLGRLTKVVKSLQREKMFHRILTVFRLRLFFFSQLCKLASVVP